MLFLSLVFFIELESSLQMHAPSSKLHLEISKFSLDMQNALKDVLKALLQKDFKALGDALFNWLRF